jgi:phosphatidylserine/phosphatidylglycerophosphate/cardiolipin synthase-like enzyme
VSRTLTHRHARRALAVVLSTLLAVTLAAAPAAAWAPPSGPVYNNPYGTYAAKWRIVKTIQQAVRRAPKGSTIMMSMFLMDGKASADALIKARNRGVHVQLVFDGDDARSAMARRMARKFNRDNKPNQPIPARWGADQSFVVFCKGSCRGGNASSNNNHTKFYAFSRTGTARDVVMVSSSNLNAGGAVRGFNDMWIAKGKPGMYADYATIHREMSRDVPAGNRYRERRHGNLTSRFYPKPKGGDPVMADLRKVQCRGAKGGAGRNGRTAINVSMFAWNGDRGVKIARKLVRLGRDRCHVSIVYGAPSKEVRLLLSRAARNGVIKLWDSRRDRNGDGTYDVRTHEKYMLINGRYGADRSSWRVHTGSQNWGRGTLRGGDENTLTVVGRGAYGKYIKRWDFIVRKHSRRIG